MHSRALGDARSNRVDPAMLEAVHEDHAARYAFARPFAAGARVLDVGCATGYGAARLAEVASSVVGIDPFEPGIAYARERYAGENLSFEMGQLEDFALPSDSFDLAVAFEVIEHVPTPEDFVARVHDLLRPGGRAIFSTPHRPVSSPNGGVSDPTHIREYDSGELASVIHAGGFTTIESWGQHIGQGMWRRHHTRALLGRLDILGLRRLIPPRAKARMVVAASEVGATQLHRESFESSITRELDGAFVQLAVCTK